MVYRLHFSEYISQLWSMIMWGNKNHIIEKICSDNGFDNIKSQIAELLYGHDDISKRWDNFRTSVKHIGPATMSELLSYTNSKKFAIFNKTTITAFEYLEIPNMPKYTYQYTSDKYLYICKNIKNIANILTQEIGVSFDLLDTDYFLWDIVLPLAEEHNLISSAADECSEELPPSMHDEIKNKLVEIGTLLGFQSRAEVKIANGAIVDVIWEAQIGNMGKAIYVFEVHSKGSIDSLIMNLLKSQSNPAVQAIIAVSNEKNLEKIKKESEGIEKVEKNLKTWVFNDVITVHESLVRAHESINKLQLVPSSFIN